MDYSILKKLNKFLTSHAPMEEECHAVYLLVEIRKMLDFIDMDEEKYPMIRFYCDWMVHPYKSRKLKAIKPIIEKIENAESAAEIMKFLFMEQFYTEMKKLF